MMGTYWALSLVFLFGFVAAENFRLQPEFQAAGEEHEDEAPGRVKREFGWSEVTNLGAKVAGVEGSRFALILQLLPEKFRDAAIHQDASNITLADIRGLNSSLLEVLPAKLTSIMDSNQLGVMADELAEDNKATSLFRILDSSGDKFNASTLLGKIDTMTKEGKISDDVVHGMMQAAMQKMGLPNTWNINTITDMGEKLNLVPPEQLMRIKDSSAAKLVFEKFQKGELKLEDFKSPEALMQKKALAYNLVENSFGNPAQWTAQQLQSVAPVLPDLPRSAVEKIQPSIISQVMSTLQSVDFKEPNVGATIVSKLMAAMVPDLKGATQGIFGSFLSRLGPLAAFLSPKQINELPKDSRQLAMENLINGMDEIAEKAPVKVADDLFAIKLEDKTVEGLQSTDIQNLGATLLQDAPLKLLDKAVDIGALDTGLLNELSNKTGVKLNMELAEKLGGLMYQKTGPRLDLKSFPATFMGAIPIDNFRSLLNNPRSALLNIANFPDALNDVQKGTLVEKLQEGDPSSLASELLPAQLKTAINSNDLNSLSIGDLKKIASDLPGNMVPNLMYAAKKIGNRAVTEKDLKEDPNLIGSLSVDNVKSVVPKDLQGILYEVGDSTEGVSDKVARLLKNKFTSYLQNITGDQTERKMLEHMTSAEVVNLPGLILSQFGLDALTSPKIKPESKIQIASQVGKVPDQAYAQLPKEKREKILEEGLKAMDLFVSGDIQSADAAAMGNAVQDLPADAIKRLTPEAFDQVLPVLQGTTSEEGLHVRACLKKDQQEAISKKITDAYGPPETWDTHIVRSLCCSAHTLGIEALAKIADEAIIDCHCVADRKAPSHLAEMKETIEESCKYNIGEDRGGLDEGLKNLKSRIAFAAKNLVKDSIVSASRMKRDADQEMLTCKAIESAGSGSYFSAADLKTLTHDDVKTCFIYLGKEELDMEQAKALWEVIVDAYGSVSAIPPEKVRALGWIITAATPEDIGQLTLNNINVIASLGEYRHLEDEQLKALANQVKQDWTAKKMQDFTYYDLIALKHILCGYDKSDLEQIRPSAYKEAASMLNSLKMCRIEALQGLASLAMNDDAFGNPEKWMAADVKSVGVVIAGLTAEAFSSIPAAAMDGLSMATVKSVPPETFESLMPDHVERFPLAAARAVSHQQKEKLSAESQEALEVALVGEKDKDSAAGAVASSVSMIVATATFCLIKYGILN